MFKPKASRSVRGVYKACSGYKIIDVIDKKRLFLQPAKIKKIATHLARLVKVWL